MKSKLGLAIGVGLLSASAAAAEGDRYAVEPSRYGIPQCRFHSVPDLLLTSDRTQGVENAKFQVKANEPSDREIAFNVSAQSAEGASNWQGILGDPWFTITDSRFREQGIVRAELALDGKPLDLAVSADHTRSGSGRTAVVTVGPRVQTPVEQWFAAFDRGSTVSVRVFDAGGNAYGPWSFDISALRRVPGVLKAARWACS